MSVQQNHYEIIGAKFGYDEFHEGIKAAKQMDEYALEDYLDDYHDSAFKGIHHINQLCIISDGMSGEYVYVGYVLQKSKNYGSLGDYRSKGRAPSAKTVRKLIKEQFGLNVPCKRHSFTHYR